MLNFQLDDVFDCAVTFSAAYKCHLVGHHGPDFTLEGFTKMSELAIWALHCQVATDYFVCCMEAR